jgi:FAD/FMN-containing dehydrogenase
LDLKRIFSDVLSESEICDDRGEIAARLKDCSGKETPFEVPGILKPRQREQIKKIVEICNQRRISLYPISTGHNWGYGSARPSSNSSIVLDLASINRILDFCPDSGVVTLEPGVTQSDLFHYLQKGGFNYLVPTHGGGPSCSIIGNALERGYGLTPHGDHFSAVTSLEAVLGNGEIFTSYLGSKSQDLDKIFKWGVGPYIDGLFSQSSLGIVTKMSLRLAAKTEQVLSCLFKVKPDAEFGAVVRVINGILGDYPGIVNACNLMNAPRMLSMVLLPEQRQHVFSEDEIRLFSKKYFLAPWTGFAGVYGTHAVCKAAAREIKKRLKPVANHVYFVDRKKLRLGKSFSRWLPKNHTLRQALDKLTDSLEILSGKPTEAALPLAYLTAQKPRERCNPSQDGCGLIWYSPIIPFKADLPEKYATLVERICKKFGMEPLITFTVLAPGLSDSTVPLVFNRDNPERCLKAQQCYLELYQEIAKIGCLPYRYGVDHMGLLYETSSPFWETVKKIKLSIDPNGVLSPGRYDGFLGQPKK